jgi:hypothetical protein
VSGTDKLRPQLGGEFVWGHKMRDLAVPTLTITARLLAIYAAGLIFVAQHVADRYTPILYPVVVRRIGGIWLGLLGAIVLAPLGLALIKYSFPTNMAQVALLVCGAQHPGWRRPTGRLST